MPRSSSRSCRPASSGTLDGRRRPLSFGSRVAAVPALEGSSGPETRCRVVGHVDAHPRAPLLMKPELSSGFLLPLWRHTLRRFLLDSSRAASPRPVPSRPSEVPYRSSCCHERWARRLHWATRPCSTVEFVAVLDVAIEGGPVLPWACVPTRRFSDFAVAKPFTGAHRTLWPPGRRTTPKRSTPALTFTAGPGSSHRSGSIGPARDLRRGAEAPGTGQHHRQSKTNLRLQAVASSGARRRSDSGALDAFPSSPTGTHEHQPSPGTGEAESWEV